MPGARCIVLMRDSGPECCLRIEGMIKVWDLSFVWSGFIFNVVSGIGLVSVEFALVLNFDLELLLFDESPRSSWRVLFIVCVPLNSTVRWGLKSKVLRSSVRLIDVMFLPTRLNKRIKIPAVGPQKELTLIESLLTLHIHRFVPLILHINCCSVTLVDLFELFSKLVWKLRDAKVRSVRWSIQLEWRHHFSWLLKCHWCFKYLAG